MPYEQRRLGLPGTGRAGTLPSLWPPAVSQPGWNLVTNAWILLPTRGVEPEFLGMSFQIIQGRRPASA